MTEKETTIIIITCNNCGHKEVCKWWAQITQNAEEFYPFHSEVYSTLVKQRDEYLNEIALIQAKYCPYKKFEVKT